jgi:predicted nucleic acid-binding protein
MALVLIDTSSWTQALRRNGDISIRARVEALLANGQAAWCDAVRLELWNGVRGKIEQQKLRELEQFLPSLPITSEVWNETCALAEAARTGGLNVPAIDLLIFACARHHGVTVEHADRHYVLLEQLK